ncbi:hypothetical protein GVAV_001270 [Gurleya vavrai]
MEPEHELQKAQEYDFSLIDPDYKSKETFFERLSYSINVFNNSQYDIYIKLEVIVKKILFHLSFAEMKKNITTKLLIRNEKNIIIDDPKLMEIQRLSRKIKNELFSMSEKRLPYKDLKAIISVLGSFIDQNKDEVLFEITKSYFNNYHLRLSYDHKFLFSI